VENKAADGVTANVAARSVATAPKPIIPELPLSNAAPTKRENAPPRDEALLTQQTALPTTDVEIPALEGALLATRQKQSSEDYYRERRSMLVSLYRVQ
jgi:hypothetical protein